MIVVVYTLIAYRLYNRVWIYHTTRTLIYSLLEEYRVFLCLPYLIGGNGYNFSPGFYHNQEPLSYPLQGEGVQRIYFVYCLF